MALIKLGNILNVLASRESRQITMSSCYHRCAKWTITRRMRMRYSVTKPTERANKTNQMKLIPKKYEDDERGRERERKDKKKKKNTSNQISNMYTALLCYLHKREITIVCSDTFYSMERNSISIQLDTRTVWLFSCVGCQFFGCHLVFEQHKQKIIRLQNTCFFSFSRCFCLHISRWTFSTFFSVSRGKNHFLFSF